LTTALIFDFDGVIADSEILANTVLADALTKIGVPTTPAGALDRYQGKRWPEVLARVSEDIGGPLPRGFAEALVVSTDVRFRSDLREVEGASAFIRRFEGLPRCIASSSSEQRLALCLDVLGLTSYFHNRVFSADRVLRGKPYPDIFLYASATLAIDPAACIVIEDSPSGVQAGVEAGMMVIGLCAASHVRDGHGRHLIAAGAKWVVNSWLEVADLVHRRLGGRT
jgi:beta-phosphoglucomutase-like phosphatase (HAD superfamily)